MSMFLWSPSSVPDLEVNAPGSLAGGYGISSAAFGNSFPEDGLTGDLAIAQDDDAGASTDPTDACDTITCTNGGACLPFTNPDTQALEYVCDCAENYQGITCEIHQGETNVLT